MIEIEQAVLFDYGSLDSDTRAFVQEKAQSIHARLKRTAEDIIAIGHDLVEVNEKLAPIHKFLPWLRKEFDMTSRTAYRFMAVAKKFENCDIMSQFSPTDLYGFLDVPDEVIEMVEAGTIPPTIAAIREAKQEEKERVSYTPPDATSQLLQGTQYAPFEDVEEVLEDELPETIHPLDMPLYHTWKQAVQPEPSIPTLPPVMRDVHPILNTLTSKSNEWYTPQRYIEAARLLMGDIDLDPASCHEANQTVKATAYYDSSMNGIDKPWLGRVWLNPPYGRDEAGSNQDIWSHRLIKQYDAGITVEAVLLVNASVDTKWFQRLFHYPVCFPDHRINFYSPDASVSGSTHGSALVYFGTQPERFFEIFSELGAVVRRW